ncbi:MaoC/PaaZ C-terminal domain-containing protein [Arthrobacter sp. Br18]|uniref:MaoC family dehydratase n=1 Tax=Arthrobacter sp. Br18 TaxID=1312954 RepID=UPI00047A22EF|nr:MaoC/PaaZ C-terminal domain-containing protein [Arthrobacter sp. Br18]
MSEVVLRQVPGLPALYRDAVLLAARRRFRGAAVPLTVPEIRYRADGVRVEARALTAFQHLLGEPARDTLPSAYVHAVAFPVAMSLLARPDFPLPLLGMVHLGNTVQQSRSIAVSERLDIVASAENLRAHRAGTQVDVVTEVSVEGVPVWTGRSVYLTRSVLLPATADTPTPDRPAETPFAPPVPTAVWRFDGSAGRRYAAVSGDWNPIHLSAFSAKALGMKRSIAHGMYLAARMLAQACPGPTDDLRWSIDFATPVLLPGMVAVAFTDATPSGNLQGTPREGKQLPESGLPGRSRPGGAGGTGSAHPDVTPAGRVRTDIVGWSRERSRPHFTGRVERSA